MSFQLDGVSKRRFYVYYCGETWPSLEGTSNAARYVLRLAAAFFNRTMSAVTLSLMGWPNFATHQISSKTDYITPKFSIVDVHHDRGMSVLSALVMLYIDDTATNFAHSG